jgi:hypothetical protein
MVDKLFVFLQWLAPTLEINVTLLVEEFNCNFKISKNWEHTMMMETFFSKFPDLAQKETRSITILDESHGLKVGQYSFVELFCTKADCDCRRAMISVLGPENKLYATLGYGWENSKFYSDWMFGDEKFGEKVVGAHIYEMTPQTEHTDRLLLIFREMVKDAIYANRIKSHYKLFKGMEADYPSPKKVRSPFGQNFFNRNMKEL